MTEGHTNWTENNFGLTDTQTAFLGIQSSYSASMGTSYQGEVANLPTTPYRWAPCPEWEQTGRCKYNEMCYRRHGPEDNRIVPQGWEKKRSMRSSSQSSAHGASSAGSTASAGNYANGGNANWNGRSSGQRSSASGSRSAVGYNGMSSIASASLSNLSQAQGSTTYQSHSASYPSFSSLPGIMSPDSYDSDTATSPPILSPSILSPLLTSPTLSHRVSLNSSPRDSIDHHSAPVIEKPWIWQPCRHWQESGSCRYGDSCKYRHGPEDRRERPAPRPPPHSHSHNSSLHMIRSPSNSSMESSSTFSAAGDSILGHSRPNISLQPIGAQITSPNASMGSLPPYHPTASVIAGLGTPSGNSVIWDMFSPAANQMSPPLAGGGAGDNANGVMQNFSEHLQKLCMHFPDPSELQTELNSLHIQAMIAVQLQREMFLPTPVQEPMRHLLRNIAISSNPNEWRHALTRVQDVLNALLDHLFNKFVSVSISSPSSSFGQLPIDVPSKLSMVQPYIGGRLSGSISELYELGQRASLGLFSPSQEEVITILEQIRRIAASTSKTV